MSIALSLFAVLFVGLLLSCGAFSVILDHKRSGFTVFLSSVILNVWIMQCSVIINIIIMSLMTKTANNLSSCHGSKVWFSFSVLSSTSRPLYLYEYVSFFHVSSMTWLQPQHHVSKISSYGEVYRARASAVTGKAEKECESQSVREQRIQMSGDITETNAKAAFSRDEARHAFFTAAQTTWHLDGPFLLAAFFPPWCRQKRKERVSLMVAERNGGLLHGGRGEDTRSPA